METQRVIKQVLAKLDAKGGVKNVCLVACGGSLGAFYPAKVFLETESKDLRVGYYTSNEFVHALPASFGENSLLIVASHRGNTPETVKAAQVAKEMGATVIGLTHFTETPLADHCDHVLDYTFGDGKDIAGEKAMICLLLAVELLHQTVAYAHYDAFMQGVERIDGIVKNGSKLVAKRALTFAEEYKNDSVIYTMGSGAGFGAAYIQSICIFMEMQWIHSAALHTGEFFHGPFEITDANTPFVIQLSEGKTRALDERSLAFLKTYAKRVEVLDAKELGLSTIDAAVVDYFNHSLFNNVYAVYNKALAETRQHPLTTRRYMWKVSY